MTRPLMQSAIPDAMLAPLGRVVVYYGLLEQSVTLLAISLTGISQLQGRLVLDRRRLEELTKLCDVLVENHGPPPSWRDEWAELTKEIGEATRDRNDLVHGSWGAAGKPNTAATMNYTARKDLAVRSKEWNVASVNAVADRCAVLAGRVNDMAYKIRSLVKTVEISEDGVLRLDD